MRADNTEHLRDAARHRAESTRVRADEALAQLLAAGAPVSVTGLMRAARVSRSWLYTQPDLLRQISDSGRASVGTQRISVPPEQRASLASLHRRLDLAQDRIARLSEENRGLRSELARAYGRLRADQAE